MKRKSLKKSLYRVFMLSVILPFVTISILISFFFYNQLYENYLKNNHIILQTLTNYVESSIDNLQQVFLQYLFDTNISKFYRYVSKNDIYASEKNMYNYIRYSSKYRSSLNNYFTTYSSYYKGIGYIPKDKEDIFYLVRYGSNLIHYQDENIRNRKYYRELTELPLGDIMFFDANMLEGCQEYEYKENTFYMLRCINRIETATKQGYIFLEVDDSIFSDVTCDVSVPKGGGISMYFPNGEIAYSMGSKFELDKDQVDSLKNIMGKAVRINGTDYYIYSQCDKQFGITIFYFLPQSTILREALQVSESVILIWFFSLLAAFLIFIKVSQQISKSTERIIESINMYQPRIQMNDGDNREYEIKEFNDISKALINKNERIEYLLEHEYIWKMNQQAAEYRAMQSEINPHFFYNVMNIFQALNRLEERQKLNDGIINLSKIFRYTCNGENNSTIEKECRFIEQYLELEKLRFEERFEYRIKIKEEVGNVSIPKLLLQPLIENAIRHGMPSSGKLLIVINADFLSAKDQTRLVWISIANDGIPFERENLYGENHVGIKNVEERLRIAYPDSVLWFARSDEFGTICNILISQR